MQRVQADTGSVLAKASLQVVLPCMQLLDLQSHKKERLFVRLLQRFRENL